MGERDRYGLCVLHQLSLTKETIIILNYMTCRQELHVTYNSNIICYTPEQEKRKEERARLGRERKRERENKRKPILWSV